MFCRSLFNLLCFSISSWCCLSVFVLRLVSTPLVSSQLSEEQDEIISARQVRLYNSFGQINTESNMNLVKCLLLIVICFNFVLPTYHHTLCTRVFISYQTFLLTAILSSLCCYSHLLNITCLLALISFVLSDSPLTYWVMSDVIFLITNQRRAYTYCSQTLSNYLAVQSVDVQCFLDERYS